MDNFGVVEVASQRRAVAPGWAYVPDTSSQSLPPAVLAAMDAAASAAYGPGAGAGAGLAGTAAKSFRKRSTRNQGGAGAIGSSVALFSHLNSRQETKLRKELELLGRDCGAAAGNGRDSAIPIPATAVKAQNKYTPNVRKILASQKSFSNHLDDFNALHALHESNQHLHHSHSHGHGADDAIASPAATASATGAASRSSSRRPPRKDAIKDTGKDAKKGSSRRSTSAAIASSTDSPMPDAPPDKIDDANGATAQDLSQQPVPLSAAPSSSILLAYTGPQPPPHPQDDNPLLISGMPPLPTDDELRSLVQSPPLSYVQARAIYGEDDSRYPTRVFCEICGYWGRVKCTKCGTPVCALECLELHREECITRYGL
ncbi:hypothetical protein SEPCBS119000_003321 [Sporothrix epigloea]|uniref:HIT-type domain-containing protein n=1 Tax=Sporothrix epigloea TaxID=1892477 RepID=A0ABP0DPN5_9PEZI